MKPTPKQTYHPFILLSFYLNILPGDLLITIPRSTRHEWKQRPLQTSFGYEWYCNNAHLLTTLEHIAVNKRLLQVNKALIRIIAIHQFLQRNKTHIRLKLFNAANTAVLNIQKVQQTLGKQFALKLLNITHQSYYKIRQHRRCNRSLLNLCVLRHPSQLLRKEVQVIKKYAMDNRYIHWPLSSVYLQIIREGAAAFHISTFYKYAAILNLKRIKISHRRKNHHVGIRAAAPLQLLHADITVFKTMDNVKAYIYIIQDNFSRAILGYRIALERKAAIMKELLADVYNQHLKPYYLKTPVNRIPTDTAILRKARGVFGSSPSERPGEVCCSFMTDDGCENYGVVKDFINSAENPFLEHIIAQQTVEYSNSMIEALHKNLKYRFLYHKHIPDINSLSKYLLQAIEDYSNRPHTVLNGLTPLEVLNGKSLDRNLFQKQIAIAKAERILINKQEKCCQYSF